MNADSRRSSLRFSAFICGLLFLSGCTPRQEAQEIVDVEPERQVNTDLAFPKNPHRWAFVSTSVHLAAGDQFPGYHVVVANPFAARLLEEGKSADRGIKFAQFIYEAQPEQFGFVPGALRRVNLMVQDPDRYRGTNGWGFASYDASGSPIPVDASTDCVGCHATGPVTQYFPNKNATMRLSD